jgi:hypothetical protein
VRSSARLLQQFTLSGSASLAPERQEFPEQEPYEHKADRENQYQGRGSRQEGECRRWPFDEKKSSVILCDQSPRCTQHLCSDTILAGNHVPG